MTLTERLAALGIEVPEVEALRRVPHLVLDDDCWYSCPKSGECCRDDVDETQCNCGADYHNARIDAALAALVGVIERQQKDTEYWMQQAEAESKQWAGEAGKLQALYEQAEAEVKRLTEECDQTLIERGKLLAEVERLKTEMVLVSDGARADHEYYLKAKAEIEKLKNQLKVVTKGCAL